MRLGLGGEELAGVTSGETAHVSTIIWNGFKAVLVVFVSVRQCRALCCIRGTASRGIEVGV